MNMYLFMVNGPCYFLRKKITGRIEIWSSEVNTCEVASKMVIFFNQVDQITCISNLQSSCHPGYTATYNKHIRTHINRHALKLLVKFNPADGCINQRLGFFCCLLRVIMNPAALFAYIGHFKKILVQTCRTESIAESTLMHVRAAGSYNNPVKLVIPYILADHLLPGIGTHIFIGPCQGNIGQV